MGGGAGRGPHEAWAAALTGREVFVSFITVGEILRGAAMAGWSATRTAEWERRLREYTVIPGTVAVARAYGSLGARSYRQLADNDLRIAATALAFDLPIATGDERLVDVAASFGISIVTA